MSQRIFPKVFVLGFLIAATILSGLLVSVSAQSDQSPSELIVNGEFGSGLTGWNVTGMVGVVMGYPLPYSGGHSVILGYRYTRGVLSQQFSLPKGASGQLSLWSLASPEEGPLLTVVLLAQNGSVINRWVIDAYLDWQQLSYVIDSSYSGQLLTLTLISYPEYTRNYGLPRSHVPSPSSYAYVSDVSVTSSIPIPEFPNLLIALTSIAMVSIFLKRARTKQISE